MRRFALVLLAGLVCLCCPLPTRADDLTPPDEEPEVPSDDEAPVLSRPSGP